MPFESPDYPLGELLGGVREAKIQLPDFQREWKWDDERIASLLTSISLGHPVGVVMMLERGGDADGFATRPLAGVTSTKPPERLLLDGQQRLTSLYQALLAGDAVDTMDSRGKKLKRWYYLDMKAVLEETDPDEAIRSVPEDRMVRDNFGRDVKADYSSLDLECQNEMFPLNRVFDHEATNKWMVSYLRLDEEGIGERLDRWSRFQGEALANFTNYLIPVIVLTRNTPREAVCTVFEKVNTGGVPLNVFELLTATFAADGFRLADDWAERRKRLLQKPVLRDVENTDFLQVVTLLATRQRRLVHQGNPDEAPGISCKRRDILRLRLAEYQEWAERALEGLEWAASFLGNEHIFGASDLPYRTQLIPLAAFRAVVGPDIENHGTMAKARQWFWCGVLGELYGAATETRFARDIEQGVPWLKGGATPRTVEDAGFRSGRLMTLRTRNSAAYKGIYALLMRSGGLDWQKHQPLDLATFFDYRIDIHHIFPKSWCEKNDIEPAMRESIVNKTAISATTNRSIGGRAPSVYMKTLEQAAGLDPASLDSIVATHAIDVSKLRSDDFEGFFSDRKQRLLDLISEAMGKQVIREEGDEANPEAFEPISDAEFEFENLEPDAPPAGEAEGSDGEAVPNGWSEVQEPPSRQFFPPESQDERQATPEQKFGTAMLEIYRRADAELGYRPTYFLRMLSDEGPLQAARQLVMVDQPSEGFKRLLSEGRLDLTVEAHVIQPQFADLFEPEVVDRARRRLDECGYEGQ